MSEFQERWEIPGVEFLPGTGENGTKEGAVKRYLAFSVGPRSPSVPYFELAKSCRPVCSSHLRANAMAPSRTQQLLQVATEVSSSSAGSALGSRWHT